MEKILLAIDAINYNKNAVHFACYLGNLTQSKITGVFLENIIAEERPVIKQLYGKHYLDFEVDEQSGEHHAKMTFIEKNISLFKEDCTNRGVSWNLHHDRKMPAHEIISESRFADVIIVDAVTSFNNRYEGPPTQFVRDILKESECPVIIAPDSFGGIDEIVFAYDGSASSVFAIKQFTYLFPEFHNTKVTILQANETGEWLDHDKYKFNEWLKDHYINMSFEALMGKTDTKLFEFLFMKVNMFLVMGAYGRSALSQFFKHSHADLLIKTTTQPVFIAHL